MCGKWRYSTRIGCTFRGRCKKVYYREHRAIDSNIQSCHQMEETHQKGTNQLLDFQFTTELYDKCV